MGRPISLTFACSRLGFWYQWSRPTEIAVDGYSKGNIVRAQHLSHCLAVSLLAVSATFASALPKALADDCPDIGVAFARGTGEPPGVGTVGQSFVDSLRAQAGDRTVGVHGVIYPASSNFTGGLEFTSNVVDGVRDETSHLQGVIAACPDIQMVLGGYSQGAVVTAFATSDAAPADVPAEYLPAPMPPEVAEHVAAVVLFGKPSGDALIKYGAPADIGPLYAGKSLELCAAGDVVCAPGPSADPNGAHGSYTMNGMTNEAAAFAISRL